MAINKKTLHDFAERWRGKGYEKGDTQQFWIQLLRIMGYPYVDDVKFEHHLRSGGFIDVWICDADVLVEQKALGIDLDKPELRQGKRKTPLEQALDYVEELPRPQQPRYVVTCNFATFRVYDRDEWSKSELENHAFEFTLEEFAEHPEYMSFVNDPENSRLEKEKTVSESAGRLIGVLYDKMRKGYLDPESEASMHALNVLCVRLVFCLYCEDADLFEKNAFYNYLKDIPANGVRMAIKRLFRALDTPPSDRDPYDIELKSFPYVNGGLFREETEVPNFTEEMKRFLLEDVSAPVNWSQISPTIFGGIFESTLNPETRRSGGMHYTPPRDIHKVIDPLFLDDLKAEFEAIRNEPGTTPRKKKNALARFHKKICNLKFFDPACGSGNFLTETYICLRKLEDSVLNELQQGQTGFGEDEEAGGRVSLNQFYGIEINDFAVTVAETALWISRLKANGETTMFYEVGGDDFPLHEKANIVHGNALRMDWNEVLPASQCSFIMGNPPFNGGMEMSKDQKAEMRDVFDNLKGVGELDYVCAWYAKAADYVLNYPIRCAFVSTNSICQGLPVGVFWQYFKGQRNFDIDFAYRTFVWNSEASDQAHVHCVIIGFSKKGLFKLSKQLYLEDGTNIPAKNIDGYLFDEPDVFITERSSPISAVPPMMFGSMPRTKGFTVSEEQRTAFIKENPLSQKWLKPFIGATEFLNKKPRYCLWLLEADDEEIAQCPMVIERIEQVRNERSSSKAESTRKMANTPKEFAQIAQPKSGYYLLVPRHSSQKRKYLPMGFFGADVICGDSNLLVPNATIYNFGIMSSAMHNAWMRRVCGRIKSDYRYSKDIVYNNFVWPDPTPEQRKAVEQCAQVVLTTRNNHPDDSLADLYDPNGMPEDLLAAHNALDAAVEAAYNIEFDGDEEEIVSFLFKLYMEKTSLDASE